MLVAGEDAHHRAADVARQPGQLDDVLHLDLPHRHFAVLEVAGEIVVAGDVDALEAEFLDAAPQAGARRVVPIERAQVRPFAAQHHAAKAESVGLVEELLDG